MTRTSLRKLFFFALRVGVAAALIAWLVRSGRLDLQSLLGLRPDAAQWALLVPAVASVLAGLFFLSARLRWLLAAIGLRVSYAKVLRATLLGAFSGTLLPGLVGGDVVKVATLCKGLAKGRRATVGTVMADRLLGLYSWFLLSALMLLVGRVIGQVPELPRAVLALPILVAVGAPLTLVLGRVVGDRILALVPARLTDRVDPMLSSLRSLSSSPGLLLGATLLSLTNHALIIVSFAVAGAILQVPLSALHHGILDSLALTLNAVPFSPGGLGVAEGGFSYLYEAVGVADGAAVGVLGRAFSYIAYVGGGLLALVIATGGTDRGAVAGGDSQ